MIWELLLTLSLAACENKILTVNSKYRRSKAPLELKSSFLSSEAQDEVNHRSKRYYLDDHNSDYADKIRLNKTTLLNDDHGTAFVEWGGTGKGSDTIVVLTRVSSTPPTESNLYVSIDYGKTFQPKSVQVDGVDVICSYIYHSPVDHRKFMLNDIVHKAIVVSTDEGRSWNVHKTPNFTPTYIEHHPKIDNLSLGYDSNTHKLWLSRDFGVNWEAIMAEKNVKDMFWGISDYDLRNTLFITTIKTDGNLEVWSSSDFFASKSLMIDDNVIEFALVDDFYFITKKSTHTNHGDNDRDLFISYDRGTVIKVKFPPLVDKNPTTEFYIADAGLGQAFVAVSHKDNMTHLYVTEHKGENMILSLPRVLFTNQASFDQIAWLNGIEPFTDFEAIEGMSGVFIASQLDGGSVGHRRIHTVMTFNKGGTWQRVQPPQFDMYGRPFECFLPDCSLHISLMFGIKYPYAKHTPLLSKANAPGYILASGNVGRAHSTLNDVFMSNDGGVEWFQVLEGQYNFQFADHGGIAVAASRDPTTMIQYSHDEGVTWYNKTISQYTLNIYGLITEPGETSSVFNVYATYSNADKMEWLIITIDFKDFLGPVCGSSDFMTWSIRDELKNTECVLGKDTQYERKKPTSHCYIGTDYVRDVSEKPCPCQASDFECDFLYSRETAGDPCTIAEGVMESWFIPDPCHPGDHYNKSMGYYKIEGDICSGGEENIFSYKSTLCPDKGINNLTISMSPGNAVKLGTPITFTALTTSYIDDTYFTWYFKRNSTQYGTGTAGAQVVYTFTATGTYVISLTASNGAGPVVAMAVVDVDVPVSGLAIKFSPEDPAVDEGMIFVISNTKDSNGFDLGRLDYTWSVGGSSFLPLLLYSFDKAGRQTVTCNVSNSVNSQQISVSFTVSDLSITSLDAIAVDSSSIQVAWLAPSMRPGLVSAYTLKYKGVQEDSWHQTALPVNATSYLAKNLDPNTQYKFLVITTSMGGSTSEESDQVTAKTLPLNTRDPAKNVQASSKGNEVTVTWQAPSDPPNSYAVEYWKSDRPDNVKSKSPDKRTDKTVKLTDLTAGALYTIRVVATYSNSITSYSKVIAVQIEGVTPEEIGNIRGFPVNSSAVVMVWDSPDNTVEGYRIYNATTSGIIRTVSQSEVTISHLLPYTLYMFTVEPFSGSRTGTKSQIVRITTDYGTPEPVKDLKCFMKAGAAVLQWHEPDRANGPINKYLISYVDDRLSDLNIPSYVDGDTLTLSILQLPQYEQFKFSVSVQGPELVSPEAYTTCKITAGTGLPGPPTELYVKGVDIAYIELMWRAPVIADNNHLGYEVRYGVYSSGTWIGMQQVLNTTQLYATLRSGISPSTEYGITVAAHNNRGTGQPSKVLIAATLTPAIGSVEYEIRFAAVDVKSQVTDDGDFGNAIVEEIVDLTAVSRSRLGGFGITHKDNTDVKVSIWIAPRDTASDKTAPATEAVVSTLDSAIKNKKFVVGNMKAHSGQVETTQAQTGSHHDVAEIVIPGICGLLVVGLVAGLLYYRNQYQKVLRRYRFTSRYANNDNDDVNMIECAEEPEGISSDDLRGGELSITNDSSQQPSSMRNFFKRFNYTPVDQDDPDELVDDDEEHLLPL